MDLPNTGAWGATNVRLGRLWCVNGLHESGGLVSLRQRAQLDGVDPMATHELVQLVLGRQNMHRTGELGLGGLEILDRDLAGASALSWRDLASSFGVTELEGLRLAAAFALGRRVEGARRLPRPSMQSAEAVFRHLSPGMRGLQKERFMALLLDGKHRLIGLERISEGTLTTSLVHPREVFRPAIRDSAAAIVVAHNHPSGDPEPSAEDLDVTRRLLRVSRLVGIPLVDHVVMGESSWVSLRERIAFS